MSGGWFGKKEMRVFNNRSKGIRKVSIDALAFFVVSAFVIPLVSKEESFKIWCAIFILLYAKRNDIYYRGIWHALRTICKEEGFFGLYKGLGATLLGVGPNIAISFSVYETLRASWQSQRSQDSTVLVSLACGSLSGIASSTVTFPLDLVRRRMQLEGAGGRARVYSAGLFGTFGQIMRNEGLRGLYRGILPEYYKVVPSVGIVFMTYETIKLLLSDTPGE